MLVLEALDAGKGDCLIVHYGEGRDRGLMLIDGGPGGTYERVLKPRLQELRSILAGDGRALNIDPLVVSHVDDDHINGVIALAEDLSEAGSNMKGRVRVDRLWHNSFDGLAGDNPDPGDPDQVLASTAAGTRAGADYAEDLDESAATLHLRDHALEVLASYPQGQTLRNRARALGWDLNTPFGSLVQASDGPVADPLTGTFSAHVISPGEKEISAFQDKFRKFLIKKRTGEATLQDVLAAYTDPSIPNLSSIVLLLREGTRNRILLTGDALGNSVLAGLGAAEFIAPGGHIEIDLVKIMHHGSSHNVDVDFFERVVAKHYLFCGDGKHGNPERKTLEMLFAARPDGGFSLHFTARLDKIDAERKEDHARMTARRERANTRRSVAGKPTMPPIGDWSDARHSLVAFLSEKTADGVDFAVHEPGAENRIEIVLN